MSSLLQRIEAFLDRHLMEATAFGDKVVGDGHFVFDLRKGRKPRRFTVHIVEEYMDKHDRKIKRRA